MADNLELAIQLISKNSGDMAALVERLGGVTGLLAAMPNILHLIKTVNALNADRRDQTVPLQYGTQTTAEVRAFQAKHMGANEADGILGDKTWRKIKQLLGEKR